MTVKIVCDYYSTVDTEDAAVIEFEQDQEAIVDVIEELGKVARRSPYFSHIITRELKLAFPGIVKGE